MTDSILREEKYKKINKLVMLFQLFMGAIIGAYCLYNGNLYNFSQAFVAIILVFVPFVLNRFSKVKITSDLMVLYNVFCFFSVIVGSALNGYAKILYFDKVTHFASGLIISVIGFIFFHYVSRMKTSIKYEDIRLVGWFVFFFNTGIAALWEVYEYLLYVFFGIDALNMLTTMANDTLQDMIVCIIGGIIIVVYSAVKLKKQKPVFFIDMYTHFLRYNNYIE